MANIALFPGSYKPPHIGHYTAAKQAAQIAGKVMVGNYKSGSNKGIKYFNGDISNINIWSRAYNATTITNISESINASPYIGNIFYHCLKNPQESQFFLL